MTSASGDSLHLMQLTLLLNTLTPIAGYSVVKLIELTQNIAGKLCRIWVKGDHDYSVSERWLEQDEWKKDCEDESW